MASGLATVIASATGQSHEGDGPGAESGECKLLGPFSLLIQAALGALALSSLVYKRWRERPRRPLKIWSFDVSKQVVGSMLLHVANLLMSMLSSGQLSVTPSASAGYQANPCSFYLLNLAIDTTIGIPILIVLLRLLTYAFSQTPLGVPPESIQSGNYGRPPKATWWLKQSFIYFIGLLGMKAFVYFIFKLCPWIIQVGDWALKWTEGNETLQVFFVMLFFPVVMNAIQYYIIDGFIKDNKPLEHEPIPSEDGDADHHGETSDGRPRPLTGDGEMDGEFESEDEVTKVKESSIKDPPFDTTLVAKDDDYDSDHDGEESPSTAQSGSGSIGKEEELSLLKKDSKKHGKKK